MSTVPVTGNSDLRWLIVGLSIALVAVEVWSRRQPISMEMWSERACNEQILYEFRVSFLSIGKFRVNFTYFPTTANFEKKFAKSLATPSRAEQLAAVEGRAASQTGRRRRRRHRRPGGAAPAADGHRTAARAERHRRLQLRPLHAAQARRV